MKWKFKLNHFAIFVISFSTIMNCQTDNETSKLTEVWEQVPPIVSPAVHNLPPSDAIVLLGDEGLSEWEHEDGSSPKWNYYEGVITVVDETGFLRTKRKFSDCQLHIEWRIPKIVEGEGQGRGNSGIFMQERYEVQVLDSYENRTYSNGQAGSIYKQHIPLVNASREPGEWQTYDIIYKAPVFEKDGSLKSPGYFTVLHNGILIQNHVEIKGPTVHKGEPAYELHNEKESIRLQDHGDAVSYRNIWIREL